MTEPHPTLTVVWLPSATLARLHAIPQPPQRTYRPSRYTRALEVYRLSRQRLRHGVRRRGKGRWPS